MKIEQEVPESIPLSKIQAFLADLGIDATYLREFHCGSDGVYVEVLALDKDGEPYVHGPSHDVAVHRIAIPLDNEA